MYASYQLKVQTKTAVDDGIGGQTFTWADSTTLRGYLDLVTGTDLPGGSTGNAYVENSTHLAIIPGGGTVTEEDRIIGTDGKIYDVTYVDDPVGIGHHLEIYLRHNGERVSG